MKSGIAIFSLTFVMDSTVLAQDIQWKQPTDVQLKQMRADIAKSKELRKNLPTKEQMEELDREMAPVDARLRKLGRDAERLADKHSAEMKMDLHTLISRETIAESIPIHRAYRAAYLEAISIHSKWGERHHRDACVRQAEKEKAYLTPMSDEWLATMPAMPLSDLSKQHAASDYMYQGAFVGFMMSVGRWGGGSELIRLSGVCGGVAESEPGTLRSE